MRSASGISPARPAQPRGRRARDPGAAPNDTGAARALQPRTLVALSQLFDDASVAEPCARAKQVALL